MRAIRSRTTGFVAVALLSWIGLGCAPDSRGEDPLVQQAAQEVARGDSDGGASPGGSSKHAAPIVRVDVSRDPALFEDFFRFSYISDPKLVPRQLNRSNALRAFMTASFFYTPALPVANAVQYVGLADVPEQNFAAYRCRPSDPSALDPVLATWPNVFRIIQQDFAAKYACPAGGAAENQLLCLSQTYTDNPTSRVTVGLANTFDIAAQIFQDAQLTKTINTLYGIFPAFAGLGYAIKGSANDAVLTTNEALRDAIAPEYLVKNATFVQGGCRCILVRPYEGRSQDPIDPEFVWQEGGSETCREVDRLRRVSDGPHTR